MSGWVEDALHLWAHIRGEYQDTVEEGVELFRYKDIDLWDRKHKNKAAFALGDLIMYRSEHDITPKVLRHELRHCEQIRQHGGLCKFLPRYYYQMIKAWLLSGDTDNNPYEQDALRAETLVK